MSTKLRIWHLFEQYSIDSLYKHHTPEILPLLSSFAVMHFPSLDVLSFKHEHLILFLKKRMMSLSFPSVKSLSLIRTEIQSSVPLAIASSLHINKAMKERCHFVGNVFAAEAH